MCVAKQWILLVKKSELSCCGESKRSAEVQLYNRAVGEPGLLSIAENSSA